MPLLSYIEQGTKFIYSYDLVVVVRVLLYSNHVGRQDTLRRVGV